MCWMTSLHLQVFITVMPQAIARARRTVYYAVFVLLAVLLLRFIYVLNVNSYGIVSR